MKKYLWKIVLALLAMVLVPIISSYNSLVQREENIGEAWGNVESAYQRRADLIPNLVNAVKGYAAHEQNTLIEVIEARTKAASITIKPENLNSVSMHEFQEVQEGVGSALSRLMVVVEQYPDLKANQNFLNLQEQLEGTENRIAYVRTEFNKTVKVYNIKRRGFLTRLWVKWFYPQFEVKFPFEAKPGADITPKVDFSK